MQITCTINHKSYDIETDATTRVLDIIRALGFTSLKEGCGEGECGACSLFVNKKLVNSCLMLASQIDGAEILTLEGLQEETKSLRENFESCGSVQCGFCTSGFVLRGYDYIQHNGPKDAQTLKYALDGNLCRCTGYQKIEEAILKSIK